jgi:predicted dehydrogenase
MRIGVIGTGMMGKNHMRVVHELPEMELTCAMDINGETLETASEPYSIRQFRKFEDMVDHVDAVMVSSPTDTHHHITRFFLEQRKNVMVEKPFAVDVEQADELIGLAEKHRLVLAVGHIERFNPAVEYINSLVETPLFIEIQRLGSFSPRSLDVDVIMDLMIHDLDIILQWDRSPVEHIHAVGVPIVSGKIDIANVRLEFRSGLVANITASRVSQKKTRKLRIFQKNHYLSVDYKKQRVKSYRLNQGEIEESIPEIKSVEPLKSQWLGFFKSITTGEKCHVTSNEGRNALALALRISQSIKTNFDI